LLGCGWSAFYPGNDSWVILGGLKGPSRHVKDVKKHLSCQSSNTFSLFLKIGKQKKCDKKNEPLLPRGTKITC
jgi:hypothetical protein